MPEPETITAENLCACSTPGHSHPRSLHETGQQTVTVTIHFPRANPGPAHTARMLALLKFVEDHDGQVTHADVVNSPGVTTAEEDA